jgi:hypothetical protein
MDAVGTVEDVIAVVLSAGRTGVIGEDADA